MGDEKRSSVAAKAEALKKAGLHPVVTAIILLASTPGFYEFFLNNTDDEANRKAEVAYEVLAKEVEHLRKDDRDLQREIQNIRNFLLMGHAARMGVKMVDPIDSFSDTTEEAAEEDAIVKDEAASVAAGGGRGSAPTDEAASGPSKTSQGPTAAQRDALEEEDPIERRDKLPELEDMIK